MMSEAKEKYQELVDYIFKKYTLERQMPDEEHKRHTVSNNYIKELEADLIEMIEGGAKYVQQKKIKEMDKNRRSRHLDKRYKE